MGQTIACEARVGGVKDRGTALLETDEVIFRGVRARVVVARSEIRDVRADAGWLAIVHAGGTLELALGERAAKWVDAIRNPKSALDKLGIPPGARVALVAMDAAPTLAAELEARGVVAKSGAPRSAVDVVIFGVDAEAALSRVPALAEKIAPDGALWIVRPKGKDGVDELAVLGAGRRAGLVDVKVARFSETHTAAKFVVPVAKRATKARAGR